MGHRTPATIEVLLKVILDELEPSGLREEAAGVLGDIYKEVGADEEAIARIPDYYRGHLLYSLRNGK
jgi:hypothetical protein